MDPGIQLLRHLKTVPNLISEDPAVVTPPAQKSFMDMPWESFSRLLAEKKPTGSLASRSQENLSLDSDIEEDDNVLAANWDGMTGAQARQ
ncbi:hypothetical protein BC938DRAFT_477710 [Jimgerdemannia flammicorona]|uniref:Uncharacterized protein n=1 Tax=Jimgerdemannia flammicorona TaxID=994334 RepID=A0A433P857_9FUNG|nr:hypothetical protein BC938DRAFT_477710 [Jimgerdemannia flammicorona]